MKTKEYTNGLVLLYEKNIGGNKDSFHINILTGSTLETEKQLGINHLVEHLMFKSSFKRSTRQISEELEIQGAIINAWTNYDNVCFHFDCLSDKIDKCAEIYADMLFNKDISSEEFKKERDVVCQEIAMYKDDYEATNEENYFNNFWNMKPVAGSIESVSKITLDQVNKFIKKRYVPANMVISVCSHLKFSKIQKIVNKYFGTVNNPEDYINLRNEWMEKKVFKRDHFGELLSVKQKTSQVQVLHAFYLPRQSATINAYCSNLLSCGLSSILFREIREKYGLCYTINSNEVVLFPNIFNKTTNVILIKSSMEAKNIDKYLDVLPKVIKNLPALLTNNDVEKTVNIWKTQGTKSAEVAYDMFYKYCNPEQRYYGKNLYKEKEYILKNANKIAKDCVDIMKCSRFDVAILGNVKKKKSR